MDMGVVRHRRAPSVQHRNHACTRTKVLWIGGDLDHRVRAGAHQQIVDLAFVLMCDVGNGFGQREDQWKYRTGSSSASRAASQVLAAAA